MGFQICRTDINPIKHIWDQEVQCPQKGKAVCASYLIDGIGPSLNTIKPIVGQRWSITLLNRIFSFQFPGHWEYVYNYVFPSLLSFPSFLSPSQIPSLLLFSSYTLPSHHHRPKWINPSDGAWGCTYSALTFLLQPFLWSCSGSQ